MKRSVVLAGGITLALTAWVASGFFGDGGGTVNGQAPTGDSAPDEAFTVRVLDVAPQSFTRTLTIPGRTAALRSVDLKAEVAGRVIETPAEKGDRVEKDALLCRIAENDRRANLAEARALAAQRELEYQAALRLQEQGHRSATQVAAAKAQHEAALAQVSQMRIALENTEIRAPFAGRVEDRPVDAGDYLQVGDICARLLDEDPFLAIGEVSEQDIDHIGAGDVAQVTLITGETLEGRVRFVAATATDRTRTYPVEVELGNPALTLREGMTADIRVPLETRTAHRIPSNAVVLGDDGSLGVRIVDDGDRVRFRPIDILEDRNGAFFVSGLNGPVRVITVGQEFVRAGETVDTAPASEDIG